MFTWMFFAHFPLNNSLARFFTSWEIVAIVSGSFALFLCLCIYLVPLNEFPIVFFKRSCFSSYSFCFGLIFCLTEFAISCTLHRLSIVRSFWVCVRCKCASGKGNLLLFKKQREREKNKKCSHKCGTSAYIIKVHQSRQFHNAIAHRFSLFAPYITQGMV